MRRLAPLLLLLSLAACDAASGGNDGPLALGIVAGNHQTVEAGAEKLPDPVTAKMVREPGGGITLRLVTPAYAQGTTVNGSPVPGAVVCAVSITDDAMEPFTPCTNTDQNGQATFFFTPPTKVGTPMSEIRGTVEGEPAVFDTASATVVAGPGVAAAGDHWWFVPAVAGGDSALATVVPLVDQYGNPQPNVRLEAVGPWLVVLDTVIGSVGAKSVRLVGTPAMGDTMTLRWLNADGSVAVDGVAVYDSINVTDQSTSPPTTFRTWYARMVRRADYTH